MTADIGPGKAPADEAAGGHAARRALLVVPTAAAAVALAAGAAPASVYQGVLGVTDPGGAGTTVTYVADPGPDGDTFVNRCDGAADDGAAVAATPTEDLVVQVDSHDTTDCNGPHGLPDGTYYVNVYDGDTYHDEAHGLLGCNFEHTFRSCNSDHDAQGDYDDTDADDTEDDSHERHGDCKGDGGGSVLNKASARVSGGEFDTGNDTNGDGVDDVTITIDGTAGHDTTDSDANGSDHTSGICVSDAVGADSSPQMPLIVN